MVFQPKLVGDEILKKILLLIISAILLFGCSNTITVEFATVNEINKNSIVIENSGGIITKLEIPPTKDFTFEENNEYFFRYEVLKSKKAVLISVESIGK